MQPHEVLDAAAVQHHEHRSQDLHDEFQPGVQGNNIVKDAKDHNDDRAQQDAADLAVDLRVREDQHTCQKREEDRKTAHARDGMVVHPSAVGGNVHRAHLLRKPLHQRRDRKGKHRRAQERKPDPQNKIRIQNHSVIPLCLVSERRSLPFYIPYGGSFPQ